VDYIENTILIMKNEDAEVRVVRFREELCDAEQRLIRRNHKNESRRNALRVLPHEELVEMIIVSEDNVE
jgi:hypothetical protein